MNSNRINRHIFIFISCASIITTFYWLDTELSSAGKLSMSSAYLSLALFTGAMAIGPVNLLLGATNPNSSYLRRDLGIWSALLALFHTISGLQVHFIGRIWLYFSYPSGQSHLIPLRHDLFGLTNYLGLLSTILMLVLLLLSNNRAIKKLGIQRWKKWQRSSYLLLLILPVHGLTYQILDKRIGGYTLLLGAIVTTAITLQLAGRVKFRRSSPSL